MKYPVIKLDFIPYGFKHSTVCEAFHIDYQVMDDTYRDYIEFVKNQVIAYLEGIFIATSITLIEKDERIIMIYRSNMDQRTLKVQLNKILQEVKYYTNNKVVLSYGMNKVLLLQSNQTANMMQIHKMGDMYAQHELYTKNKTIIEDKLDNKNVNYITSVENYKKDNG